MSTKNRQIALEAKSWPFIEAKKLLKRIKKTPAKGFVLFETGFGPSGLPHIGTLAEMVRTVMVEHAFNQISDIKTKIYCFSDDMDGMRKIPDNVPNKDMLKKYLDMPLSSVPDPFGTDESFAAHNNRLLNTFLHKFNFKYEFLSATKVYKSGKFNESLVKFFNNFDSIINIMLPTLGEERKKTYSPFLPIDKHNKVLQVAVKPHNDNEISFVNSDNERQTLSIKCGHCKMQWKADWALRWHALDINYEMHGKDLTPTYKLSSKIARVIGFIPPKNFIYELFLDANGNKISKSKGNGLSVEEWLKYAMEESLFLFMYKRPTSAKELSFNIIPKYTDEFIDLANKFSSLSTKEKFDNPIFHIKKDLNFKFFCPIKYSMIINLVNVCATTEIDVLKGIIKKYKPDICLDDPFIASMIKGAVNYYSDLVKPHKKSTVFTKKEKEYISIFVAELLDNKTINEDDLEKFIYEKGKYFFEKKDLKLWFKLLYNALLGQDFGPRISSLIKLYGIEKTSQLLTSVIEK